MGKLTWEAREKLPGKVQLCAFGYIGLRQEENRILSRLATKKTVNREQFLLSLSTEELEADKWN